MASAADLREYVRRDWGLIEEVKRDLWMSQRLRMSPTEALRIADDLRAHVRAIRPDWPTPADRAADFAAHVKLTEVFARLLPKKGNPRKKKRSR